MQVIFRVAHFHICVTSGYAFLFSNSIHIHLMPQYLQEVGESCTY